MHLGCSDVWLLPSPGCKDSCTEAQHRPNAAPVLQISRVSYMCTHVFGPCYMLSIVHPDISELILISSWAHHLTCHFLLSFRYRIVTPHILTTLLQDVKVIGSLTSNQVRSIINKHPLPTSPPKCNQLGPSQPDLCGLCVPPLQGALGGGGQRGRGLGM